MKKTGIEEMIITAIYHKAEQFAFSPYDHPSDEEIEDVCDTLYEFCAGMKVFVSEPMRDFIGHIRFIYAFEIRTGKMYDGDDIDETFPHLYKEGGRR